MMVKKRSLKFMNLPPKLKIGWKNNWASDQSFPSIHLFVIFLMKSSKSVDPFLYTIFCTLLFLFDLCCTRDKHKFDAHGTFKLMTAHTHAVSVAVIYMELQAHNLNQKKNIVAKGVISHLLDNDWLTLSETHCITNKQIKWWKKRKEKIEKL